MAKNPLTEAEMKLLALSWQCMEVPPKIDYPKLAELCGHANPRSTANSFTAIKKKLAAMVPGEGGNGDDNGGSPNKQSTPAKKSPAKNKTTTPKATGSAKKRAMSDNEENGTKVKAEDASDDEPVESPTKKSKRTPIKSAKAKAAAKVEAADEDEDDDATVA